MARKKKHPEHVNHERWLVSYADFITLLFAFFVVMFAVSQVDTKKVGRFTEAFSKAAGIDMFPDKGTGFMPDDGLTKIGDDEKAEEKKKSKKDGDEDEDGNGGKGKHDLPKELKEAKAAIEAKMAAESALSGLQVITRKNEIVLRLADSIFFDPGNDELKKPAIDILHSLTPELIKRNVDIRVEGHTDSRPISNGRFRSNWDLSTARATVVILKLASEGMPPQRLSAAGYGEFRPIATNENDDGRRQNRRVDLVVSVATQPEPETTDSPDAGAKKDDKSDKSDDKADPKAEGDAKDAKDAGAAEGEATKTDASAEKDKADDKADKPEGDKGDKSDKSAEKPGEKTDGKTATTSSSEHHHSHHDRKGHDKKHEFEP